LSVPRERASLVATSLKPSADAGVNGLAQGKG
jgi:hypothetical protein